MKQYNDLQACFVKFKLYFNGDRFTKFVVLQNLPTEIGLDSLQNLLQIYLHPCKLFWIRVVCFLCK